MALLRPHLSWVPAALQVEDVARLAHSHKHVTLLFMDIVGFTGMCRTIPPTEVMAFLHTLFSALDGGSLLPSLGCRTRTSCKCKCILSS